MARLTLHLFFRRIEIEARHNIPAAGPVVFAPNHANALVDPLLLMTAMRRPLTLTAKNVLGKNVLLRWLMSALGVVTFHRREDAGRGADVKQNVRSLQICRGILADGGAVCIFPEGVSHSDPKLRDFRPGPARIAVDFVRKDGDPGRLRIVPVGLLYTEKDRMRSGVWVRFGDPIDVARWLSEHPGAGAAGLTAYLQHRVAELTLNCQTRRESAILTWAAEIMATEGRDPVPLGWPDRSVAEWFRLLGRLQTGYDALCRTQPDAVAELTIRIRQYRAQLKRAGISPGEVYLPMHFGRAALFVIRELELLVIGAPLALFGFINHAAPYYLVKWIARRLSKDKDHWASNIIYPSFLVFPFFYLVQLTAAWLLLPVLWAALYTVALPYTGYYALLYADRVPQTWRRTATFLRFLFRRADQKQLAEEGRAIVARIRELAAQLPADGLAVADLSERGGPLMALSASDLARQFREDIVTLREVFAGLGRLETSWNDARQAIAARQRGYFTPEEDDRVRQMLLAYRSYRLVLYEVINRYLDHDQLVEPEDQLRAFMIAYAAGLTLYAKTTRLVRAYERESLVREKLNEADAKFGLPGGFFEELLRAYTSLATYRRLTACNKSWQRYRREFRRGGLSREADWSWLASVIGTQRSAARKTLGYVLWHRLRYDRRTLVRSVRRPAHRARYGLRAFVGATFAPRHITPFYVPALRPQIIGELRQHLRPGDVLLVRAEQKFTTALLPGFWSHSALYLGCRRDLEALGVHRDGRVKRHWEKLSGNSDAFVIEAISPGVMISSLESCLHADQVAVLRPNVTDVDRQEAVLDAFSHVGKAYDFEFDFNATTRLVCTEIVYRAYHGRGAIHFELVKRLGRYTLSCDDIVRGLIVQADASEGGQSPFGLAALVLTDGEGKARFVPVEKAFGLLRAIAAGKRPSKLPQAEFLA